MAGSPPRPPNHPVLTPPELCAAHTAAEHRPVANALVMDTLGRLLLLATLLLTPVEAQQGRTGEQSPGWVGVRIWGRGSSMPNFPLGETEARKVRRKRGSVEGTGGMSARQ